MSDNREILDERVTYAFIFATEGSMVIKDGSTFTNMDKVSVANFYRGYLELTDFTINSLNIFDNAFQALNTEFMFDSISITSITRVSGSSARLFTIAYDSQIHISNLDIENVQFSLISSMSSSLQVYNSLIQNVTAERYIME